MIAEINDNAYSIDIPMLSLVVLATVSTLLIYHHMMEMTLEHRG
jgi:hypothetical protein